MVLFGRWKTVKHGLMLDRPVDNDDRCAGCGGDCCRSFTSVRLSWLEYKRLRSLGANRLEFFLTGQYQLNIEDGCEFLKDGRCAIYEHRPDTCRRFYCRDG